MGRILLLLGTTLFLPRNVFPLPGSFLPSPVPLHQFTCSGKLPAAVYCHCHHLLWQFQNDCQTTDHGTVFCCHKHMHNAKFWPCCIPASHSLPISPVFCYQRTSLSWSFSSLDALASLAFKTSGSETPRSDWSR